MSDEIQAVLDALTFDKRLWDMHDVARFLNRSYNTVMDKISKRPDFPNAIRIDSKPLYDPAEVKKWALSKKEKN
jgi:phage pi2 protein 07